MKSIVTGKQMQLLDKNTTEHYGVPSGILMEQASLVFVQELFLFPELSRKPDHILVVAGCGNNGGDGIAIARLLNQRGCHTEVYFAEDHKPGTTRCSVLHDLQKDIYLRYGYPIAEELTSSYDLLIDAVFGVGLTRPLEGWYLELIQQMNSLKGIKVAVDLPSGLCADSGKIMGAAFAADYSITFSFAKLGMYLWPGNEVCGRICVADMGITKESFLGEKAFALSLEERDLKELLPLRKAHSNKGSYGKVLLIAGSRNMAGAAVFAAKAAYHCGCGLVRIFTCEENRTILQTLVPEAILDTYDGVFSPETLQRAIDWADAVAAGPGLGTSENAGNMVRYLCSCCSKPMLLDADALNICAKDPGLLTACKAQLIITPHLGEMARLTGKKISDIQVELATTAKEAAEAYGLCCVLKDFHTIIASSGEEQIYLNLSGNNGMATGGSGDVLSGVIVSLLAQKMTPALAAASGVYLHGRAGDLAALSCGYRGLTASGLIDGLMAFWSRFNG